MKYRIKQVMLIALAVSFAALPALGQPDLETLLDKVDQGFQPPSRTMPGAYFAPQSRNPQMFAPQPWSGYAARPAPAPPAQMIPNAAQPNPFSKANLLQVFFGGSPSGGSSAPANAGDGSALATATQNWQLAVNEAAKADDDAARARYGQKDMRMSAASSAQYHANAARAAADRAASAAYGKSQAANDAAAKARNEANRAQAAADRARYNATVGN